MTHGNSGGPVLDSSGKVIGIATFISIDPNTGQEIAAENFVLPISLAKEFIDKAGANTEEGSFTPTYSEALDDYEANHYSSALDKFKKVDSFSPGYPGVRTYITKSESAIAAGKDLPVVAPVVSNQSQQPAATNTGSNSKCIIATAAFGTEIAPPVQFLRDFRDHRILATASGSSFINVFNAWYYSFSPYVADYERGHPWLQQIVRTSIYPLLGILNIAQKAYETIPGEYGSMVAGLVASSMIGALYFSPIALSIRQIRNSKISWKITAIAIGILTLSLVLSVLSKNTTAMMITTPIFVVGILMIVAAVSASLIMTLSRYLARRVASRS